MLKIKLEELHNLPKSCTSVMEDLRKQLAIHTPDTLYIKTSNHATFVNAAMRQIKNEKEEVEITLNGIVVKPY